MSRLLPSHRIALATLLLAACSTPGGDGDAGSSSGDTGIDTFPPGQSSTGGGDSTSEPEPTTSGSASSGSTTMDELPPCLAADIVAKVKIPRVMLVLDKSGSMVSPGTGFWDADGDDADDDGFVDGDPNMTPATPQVTRWNSLYNVVDFIVTDFEPRMDFGAVLFPSTKATKSYDAGACPVETDPEVPVGSDQGANILASIPPADDLSLLGGTPAASGIMTAIGALPRDEAIPDAKDDLRYIVLVTDGAANCAADAANNHDRFEEYDTQLAMNVAAATAAGVPTFVVGIDIEDKESPVISDGNPDATNTFVRLNELADIGGQAREGAEKFYNTNNQLELQAALMAISEVITSCTFELNLELDKYTHVAKLVVQTDKDLSDPLTYGGDQVADCDTESGWRFTDETRKSIQLCGDACSAYKSTGLVDIEFECFSP